MPISDSLEVAIGLSFIFFLASIVLASIHEAIETVLKARGANLYDGIVAMLDDPAKAGSGLTAAKAVYDHPLLRGLMKGDLSGDFRRRLPSYLPTRNFALALIDQTARGKLSTLATPSTTPKALPAAQQLRLAAEGIENAQVRRAIIQAVDLADDDMDKVRAQLETWFDGAMDRVSGWFKRRSQRIIFALGLLMAVALNVNTLTVADALSKSHALRQAVMTQAAAMEAACGPQAPCSSADMTAKGAVAELDRTSVPVGWSDAAIGALLAPTTGQWGIAGYLQILLGYLLTAFAVTLGAPFWFDVLNRLMVIRATVKPTEKSQDEAPQDPQPATAGAVAVSIVPPPAAPAPADSPAVIDDDIFATAPGPEDRLFENDLGQAVTGRS